MYHYHLRQQPAVNNAVAAAVHAYKFLCSAVLVRTRFPTSLLYDRQTRQLELFARTKYKLIFRRLLQNHESGRSFKTTGMATQRDLAVSSS